MGFEACGVGPFRYFFWFIRRGMTLEKFFAGLNNSKNVKNIQNHATLIKRNIALHSWNV